MRKIAIALAAVGLLTASTVVPFAPAEAHEWGHRGWGGGGWHGDHDNGAAIGLGLLGFMAGAALASSQPYYAPPAYGYSYAPYGYSYAYSPYSYSYGYTPYNYGSYSYSGY
ncbi:MAG TPA: hypothetical protein VNE82_10835 [Candidatus Binataceae bacterium]|nr:hypothetical protein [Candidatus Binataceae bacterium]